MYVWATSKLADEIAVGTVSSREKIRYFVLAPVLYVATGYAADYGTTYSSWLYVYEAVVVSVVTLAGAQRVASFYQKPIDAAFFEMAYLLSFPLMVKTTLAAWLAIYGGYWLFGAILPLLHAESAESAQALSYWVGRLWQVFPFLVAVAIALAFWFRLAHHVAYVVAKRGA